MTQTTTTPPPDPLLKYPSLKDSYKRIIPKALARNEIAKIITLNKIKAILLMCPTDKIAIVVCRDIHDQQLIMYPTSSLHLHSPRKLL